MARLTLPGGSRVRRSRDVRAVFDGGSSAAAGPVVVYALDQADGRLPRYGLVVGRKWGNAVRRNRIRRLLRESFRTLRPELPRGFDFLLLPRGALHELGMEAVRSHLRSAARRAAARTRDPESSRPRRPPRGRRRR